MSVHLAQFSIMHVQLQVVDRIEFDTALQACQRQIEDETDCATTLWAAHSSAMSVGHIADFTVERQQRRARSGK